MASVEALAKQKPHSIRGGGFCVHSRRAKKVLSTGYVPVGCPIEYL
ncbi:MAG: hypothetical protein AB8Y83_01485 [Coxiella endosymbiont of Haemaphysalis qinghaiensis]